MLPCAWRTTPQAGGLPTRPSPGAGAAPGALEPGGDCWRSGQFRVKMHAKPQLTIFQNIRDAKSYGFRVGSSIPRWSTMMLVPVLLAVIDNALLGQPWL